MYPVPEVFTVEVGSTSKPLNSLNLSLSEASLNRPEYLVVTPESKLYFPYKPTSTLFSLLSLASSISGSSTESVSVFTVVVVPLTVRFCAIVKLPPKETSSGKPTVTVPPEPKVTPPPDTSISFAVP